MDGGSTTGQWVDGQVQDGATRTSPYGRAYTGCFRDNVASGRGTVRWPDGLTFEGTDHVFVLFFSASLSKPIPSSFFISAIITGTCVNDAWVGSGVYTLPDGVTKHDCNFVSGLPTGWVRR